MSYSRQELAKEIEVNKEDLKAFSEAYARIRQRLVELEGGPHYEFLLEWAGTQAVMNSLVMAITRIEGLIEDMQANLEKLPVERPALRLCNEDENEQRTE